MFDGILGYVIGGLVIGLLARLSNPARIPWAGSPVKLILLGIVGAVAGR